MTKTTLTLTLLMLAAFAASVVAVRVVASDAGTNESSVEAAGGSAKSAVESPTVVKPLHTETFDLEAANPVGTSETELEVDQERADARAPDLTWYAPQSLDRFAGIS